MSIRRTASGLMLAALFPASTALAQNPTAPPPQLSPKAAYDQALHPLVLTRADISNWSDAETAALSIAIANAGKDCAARDPKTFTGADLIDLATLCSLGLQYPAVISVATLYIATDGPRPLLMQAFYNLIDAQLHLKQEPDAFASAQRMLTAVPYDTLTADTLDEAIEYMHFVNTEDALKLSLAREPLLLNSLHQASTTKPQSPSESTAAPPIHALYADGLALAALQQLSKAPAAEVAATVAALEAALPTSLSPDEAFPMDIARRRYALLGKPLPDIAQPSHPANAKSAAPLKELGDPTHFVQIPATNAITALLLFPDWCAQCLRIAVRIPETVFTVSRHEAYMYSLLAETVPPNPPPAPKSPPIATFAPAEAVNLLRHTSTIVVDRSLLDQFAATDVPYLILTDAQGVVRVLQPVGADAIAPGGSIDAAIARVGDNFPNPLLAPKPPSSAQPAKTNP